MKTDNLGKVDKMVAEKALRILEIFRSIDVEMPIGEAASFLWVTLKETSEGEGMTGAELARALPCASATASRYTTSLAKRRGLVSNPRNPTDDRQKILRLTPKGALVVRQLSAVLGAH